MFQDNKGRFIGLYLFNSNAQQFEIIRDSNTTTIINIRTIGGSLDLFTFTGPSFTHVIQQYQQIIGRPKMLPYWVHGFISKSVAYQNQSLAIEAIESYKKANISLEALGLTIDTLNGYQNFGFKALVEAIRTQYPKQRLILPFTYMIPSKNDTSLQYVVKVNQTNLLVGMSNGNDTINGYCMDPFNPDFSSKYLQPILAQEDVNLNGYWLERNVPFLLAQYSFDFKEIDPFFELPFVPTTQPIDLISLPKYATHQVSSNTTDFNFNLRGIYGSQLAIQFQGSLPNQSPPFVLSDGTFSGIGQFGIGHIEKYFENPTTFRNLTRRLISNLLSYSMFGVPYTGVYLTDDLEELTSRIFQIGVVSPLLIYQSNSNDLSNHIFNFNKSYQDCIKASLAQRMRYLVYMRTELFKLQKYGGTLHSPLFAKYSDDATLNDSDVSSIMYGSSILANFALNESQNMSTVYLPDYKWIYLNTMDVIKGYMGDKLTINVSSGIDDPVHLYQNGISTIVAFTEDTNVNGSIEDIRNKPISLSVALEGFLGGYASGQVLIEESSNPSDNLYEFYEIKAVDNFISFKQQNNGSCSVNSTVIDKIYVTFLDKEINVSCAILNDMQTVQTLYVTSYNASRQQAIIQSQDPSNPNDTSTMRISDLAFIFYGVANITKCDASLFSMKLDSVLVNESYTFQAKVFQGMSALYGGWMPAQYVNITLLSNNSIYVLFSTLQNPTLSTAAIYDRNFSEFNQSVKGFTLLDILQVNQEPFYFNVVNPQNKSQVMFTTKDQLFVSHIDFNVFNFGMPQSNMSQVFGFGERKGEFYLYNNYTYALYNNDNNVPSSFQQYGRVHEYGRNGYFPIFYSGVTTSQNFNAFVFFPSQGLEMTVHADSSSFSLLTHNSNTEFIFIFDQDFLSTVEDVQKHLKLGSMLDKTSENPTLPPHEWFFGSITVFSHQDCNFTDFVTAYLNQTQWPLDGLLLDYDSLDQYQSLSFNQTKFQNLTLDLHNLAEKGIQLISVSKSGFSTGVNDTYTRYIQDQNLSIMAPFPDYSDNLPQYGYDEQGQVIYVDYSVNTSKELLSQMISAFNSSVGCEFGIQLTRNEISDVYCKGGQCYKDEYEDKNQIWVAKPGNTDMTINTFGYAFRAIGREDFTHNLNGLMEQIQYANTNFSLPLLSDSNAMGSGKLGNVGRLLDYYEFSESDLKLATQQLQTLSLLGMPMIGFKLQNSIFQANQSAYDQLMNDFLLLNVLSPIGALDLFPSQLLRLENVNVTRWMKMRYMLIKFTRTQVFRQINEGTPLIRPVQFTFPSDEKAAELVDKSFIYGRFLVMTSNPTNYEPPGLACTVLYETQDTLCTNRSLPSDAASHDTKFPNIGQNLQILGGSIVALQDTFNQQTPIKNVRDLKTVAIDLHIVMDLNLNAIGELLVHGDNETVQAYCYLSLSLKNSELSISKKTYPSSSSNQDCLYEGFNLRNVYIYQNTFYKIAKATINGQTSMIPGPDGMNFKAFAAPSTMHISEVNSILFQTA